MNWWEQPDSLDYGSDINIGTGKIDRSIEWDPSLGESIPIMGEFFDYPWSSGEEGMIGDVYEGGWAGVPGWQNPSDWDVTQAIPALFSKWRGGKEVAESLQDYDWFNEKLSGEKLTTKLSDIVTDFESDTASSLEAMSNMSNIAGKTGFAGSGGEEKGRKHIIEKQASMGVSARSKGKAGILSHILEIRKSRQKYVDELWSSYTKFLNTNPDKRIWSSVHEGLSDEDAAICEANPDNVICNDYIQTFGGDVGEMDFDFTDDDDPIDTAIGPDSPSLGSGGASAPIEHTITEDPGNCPEGTLWNGWKCQESGGTIN